ncbi:MAG: exo-alpha-sialidase [Ignavibacteria bacterium]|nr:exo-alpha-sialidase [Ignavibacteria bacterium]
MKKIILLTVLGLSVLYAQTTTEFKLNENDFPVRQDAYGHNPCRIVGNVNDLHVIWTGVKEKFGSKESHEIFYANSKDEGLSWEKPIMITNDKYYSNNPAICVSGSTIHVVWEDERTTTERFKNGTLEVFYTRSTDNGVNWETEIKLSNSSSGATDLEPFVIAVDEIIHVAWVDYRDGNFEIYYKKSNNNGISWGSETRLTNNGAASHSPILSAYNSNIYLTWYDFRNEHCEIYFKKSSDNGNTWGSDIKISNSDYSWTYSSVITSNNNNVFIAWNQYKNKKSGIYLKRSTNYGESWSADIKISNNTGVTSTPTISHNNDIIFLAWVEEEDFKRQLKLARSLDDGQTWEQAAQITNWEGHSFEPSICFSASSLHMVWLYSGFKPDPGLYYKKIY